MIDTLHSEQSQWYDHFAPIRLLLNEADTFLLHIMNPPVTCALSLYM